MPRPQKSLDRSENASSTSDRLWGVMIVLFMSLFSVLLVRLLI